MKKITFLLLLIPIFVLAQFPIVTCSGLDCDWNQLNASIRNLVQAIVIISFWVAFLLVSIGAFLMMFTGASEAKYQQGKNLIWTAIWAYILILASGIIFDIVLEFFAPKFAIFILPQHVFAQSLEPTTWYQPLKEALMSSLKCGKNAKSIFGSLALGRLFACIFEVIGLLKNIAVVLLVFAIIASALYLISTPLFGLKNISLAYKILVWSIVGLVIILLADLIRAQIERLVK